MATRGQLKQQKQSPEQIIQALTQTPLGVTTPVQVPGPTPQFPVVPGFGYGMGISSTTPPTTQDLWAQDQGNLTGDLSNYLNQQVVAPFMNDLGNPIAEGYQAGGIPGALAGTLKGATQNVPTALYNSLVGRPASYLNSTVIDPINQGLNSQLGTPEDFLSNIWGGLKEFGGKALAGLTGEPYQPPPDQIDAVSGAGKTVTPPPKAPESAGPITPSALALPKQPDFSKVLATFEQSKPTAPEAPTKQDKINNVLLGLASSASSIDKNTPLGETIFKLGLGAAMGAISGNKETQKEQEQYQKDLQKYMADLAQMQSNVEQQGFNNQIQLINAQTGRTKAQAALSKQAQNSATVDKIYNAALAIDPQGMAQLLANSNSDTLALKASGLDDKTLASLARAKAVDQLRQQFPGIYMAIMAQLAGTTGTGLQ